MEHRDAELCDIVIVIDKSCDTKINECAETLRTMGMSIDSVDRDNGIIEGTIETYKLANIRKIECVDYVRNVFTYIADYPPGDPRNQDPEAESDAI